MGVGMKQYYSYLENESVDGGKSNINLYKEFSELLHFVPLLQINRNTPFSLSMCYSNLDDKDYGFQQGWMLNCQRIILEEETKIKVKIYEHYERIYEKVEENKFYNSEYQETIQIIKNGDYEFTFKNGDILQQKKGEIFPCLIKLKKGNTYQIWTQENNLEIVLTSKDGTINDSVCINNQQIIHYRHLNLNAEKTMIQKIEFFYNENHLIKIRRLNQNNKKIQEIIYHYTEKEFKIINLNTIKYNLYRFASNKITNKIENGLLGREENAQNITIGYLNNGRTILVKPLENQYYFFDNKGCLTNTYTNKGKGQRFLYSLVNEEKTICRLKYETIPVLSTLQHANQFSLFKNGYFLQGLQDWESDTEGMFQVVQKSFLYLNYLNAEALYIKNDTSHIGILTTYMDTLIDNHSDYAISFYLLAKYIATEVLIVRVSFYQNQQFISHEEFSVDTTITLVSQFYCFTGKCNHHCDRIKIELIALTDCDVYIKGMQFLKDFIGKKEYTYDNKGNITSITSGRNISRYQYDYLSKLITSNYYSTLVNKIGYDQYNNIKSEVKNRNLKIYSDYNERNNLINQFEYEEIGTIGETFDYDLFGNIIFQENTSDLQCSIQYTTEQIAIKKTIVGNNTTKYTYYEDNALATIQYNDLLIKSFQYNRYKQIYAIKNDVLQFFYHYNEYHNLVSIVNEDGVLLWAAEYEYYQGRYTGNYAKITRQNGNLFYYENDYENQKYAIQYRESYQNVKKDFATYQLNKNDQIIKYEDKMITDNIIYTYDVNKNLVSEISNKTNKYYLYTTYNELAGSIFQYDDIIISEEKSNEILNRILSPIEAIGYLQNQSDFATAFFELQVMPLIVDDSSGIYHSLNAFGGLRGSIPSLTGDAKNVVSINEVNAYAYLDSNEGLTYPVFTSKQSVDHQFVVGMWVKVNNYENQNLFYITTNNIQKIITVDLDNGDLVLTFYDTTGKEIFHWYSQDINIGPEKWNFISFGIEFPYSGYRKFRMQVNDYIYEVNPYHNELIDLDILIDSLMIVFIGKEYDNVKKLSGYITGIFLAEKTWINTSEMLNFYHLSKKYIIYPHHQQVKNKSIQCYFQNYQYIPLQNSFAGMNIKPIFCKYVDVQDLSNNFTFPYDETLNHCVYYAKDNALIYSFSLDTKGTVGMQFKYFTSESESSILCHCNEENSIEILQYHQQLYVKINNQSYNTFINVAPENWYFLSFSFKIENEQCLIHVVIKDKENHQQEYTNLLNIQLDLLQAVTYIGSNQDGNDLNGYITSLAVSKDYTTLFIDSISNLLYTNSLGLITKQEIKLNEKSIVSYNYSYQKDAQKIITNIDKLSIHSAHFDLQFQYEYDINKRISKVITQDTQKNYTYDSYSNLKKFTMGSNVEEYTYDSIGNRIKKFGTYGTTNYVYRNDMLYSINDMIIQYENRYPIQIGEATLKWNRGNLVEFNENNQKIIFVYDSFNRRIKKGNINYIYSGNLLTIEKHDSYQLIYYYDENKIIGFTYKDITIEKNYYYVYNLEGEIIGILDEEGTLVAEYGYTPWGEIIIHNDTSDIDISKINPIRYKGWYFDSDLNMYYCNGRYYQPEWGRFISPQDVTGLSLDSIQNLNLYLYANNNPINFTYSNSSIIESTSISGGMNNSTGSSNHSLGVLNFGSTSKGGLNLGPLASGLNMGLTLYGLYTARSELVNLLDNLSPFADDMTMLGVSIKDGVLAFNQFSWGLGKSDVFGIVFGVGLDIYDSIQRGVSLGGIALGATLTAVKDVGLIYFNKGILYGATAIGSCLGPVGTIIGFVVGGVVCIIVDISVSNQLDDLIDNIAI